MQGLTGTDVWSAPQQGSAAQLVSQLKRELQEVQQLRCSLQERLGPDSRAAGDCRTAAQATAKLDGGGSGGALPFSNKLGALDRPHLPGSAAALDAGVSKPQQLQVAGRSCAERT